MKIAISNIAWAKEHDEHMYQFLSEQGICGLEIAPTRIIDSKPYDHIEAITKWSKELLEQHGLCVPSMQSIWFGKTENIWDSLTERQLLLDYTKKAILFAESIGCHNLVFGCPKNRNRVGNTDEDRIIEFFCELADFAMNHETVIGFEANPPMYNTNYINTTMEAFALVEKVSSPGFKVNLDVGTMIANDELVEFLKGKVQKINHVHVSEPGLKPIQERSLHRELSSLLQTERYNGYVSIEMGWQEDISIVKDTIKYVKELFE